MLELLPVGLPAPAAGAFTTRAGGVSAPPYDGLNLGLHVEDDGRCVQDNRDLLAAAAGLAPGGLVFAQQVHGAGVAVVDRSSSWGRDGGVAAVDALVTTTPGLGLVVLAADCLPVLLADPRAGVVAAAHAGRAGLARGVLHATLQAMEALGAEPSHSTAVLGPAACGRCYELPAELADEVGDAVPGSRATTRTGTPSVDLTAGATALLAEAGVAVQAVGGCTIEQPQRFFSYRRDGRTGRHAGLVWLSRA
ncbi:MAG: peptidoglycan editing factor PgeF [Mycobacteriales bacterium]